MELLRQGWVNGEERWTLVVQGRGSTRPGRTLWFDVRLRLEPGDGSEYEFGADLEMSHRAGSDVTVYAPDGVYLGPSAWDLAPTLPTELLHRHALGQVLALAAAHPTGTPACTLAQLPRERAGLVPLLERATRTMYGRIDRKTRARLAALPPDLRFPLAPMLFGATERVDQSFAACPGLLLFAGALSDQSTAGAQALARFVVRGIEEGRRLDELIDETLAHWLRLCVSEVMPVDGAVLAAMRWLHELPFDERSARMKRWRLLVRRAGPEVLRGILLRPPPLDFAPDEIPTDVHRNARWYQAIARHDAAIDPTSPLGQTLGPRLSRLFSRAPMAKWTGAAVRLLQDQPTLDPAQLSSNTLTWRVLRKAQEIRATKQKLPPPPVPEHDDEHGYIQPLDCVALLRLESRVMHHCAETYAPKVQAGHSYLYRAYVGAERLTVELEPDGAAGWRIVQVKGRSNSLPSEPALRWLGRWCPLEPSLDPSRRAYRRELGLPG